MNEPIMDLIRANFVESNLKQDETLKALINIREALVSLNDKLDAVNTRLEREFPEKVENNDPIVYPE